MLIAITAKEIETSLFIFDIFIINVLIFVIAGFIAQMIDGMLGMGYGATTTSFLLSIGIQPSIASAPVHTPEIFTSGISGIFHIRYSNVDNLLFKKLVIHGIIGGILGAYIIYIIASLPDKIIKPCVSTYLLITGLIILRKSFIETTIQVKKEINPIFVGTIIGFLMQQDADGDLL